MRRFKLGGVALVSCLVLSCDTEPEPEGDDDSTAMACPQSDEGAQLTIENRTGNTMAEITMRACDGSELAMFPIPDGGLATDADLTIDLPAPGCWILSYDGEACFNDPKHQTSSMGVCGGATHVWTATADTHTCAGAGW